MSAFFGSHDVFMFKKKQTDITKSIIHHRSEDKILVSLNMFSHATTVCGRVKINVQ